MGLSQTVQPKFRKEGIRPPFTVSFNSVVNIRSVQMALGFVVTQDTPHADFDRCDTSLNRISLPNQASMITLVCDNLNTHTLGSLYQAFSPYEAFRIASRIDIVHTPKHGSWLNMAELGLSGLTRQCFTDRVGQQAEVQRRCEAWGKDRNQRQKGIDWQFTNDKAHIKLKRLYPKMHL